MGTSNVVKSALTMCSLWMKYGVGLIYAHPWHWGETEGRETLRRDTEGRGGGRDAMGRHRGETEGDRHRGVREGERQREKTEGKDKGRGTLGRDRGERR